ncbi:MAG TPA: hypothetical protein PKA05_11050 [Roseiflexaceae bacterium]|nr:hypothetical protein [Roseiflexaceae bacterium]HMP40909.1 hypothetical protein [Roseiflexaceae bacterium]
MVDTRIALLSTTPRRVFEDYHHLLDLIVPQLNTIDYVVIVPSVSPTAFPGTSAMPWQFEAIVRSLYLRGIRAYWQYPIAGDPAAFAPIAAAYHIPRAHFTTHTPDAMLWHLVPCTLTALRSTTSYPAGIIRELNHRTQQTLTIVDATTISASFDNLPLVSNLILAGHNQQALSAVVARLLGYDQAHPDLSRQAPVVIGEPAIFAAAAERAQQRRSQAFAAGWPERLVHELLKVFPPTQYREPAHRDWLYHSQWGRLFQRYQRRML